MCFIQSRYAERERLRIREKNKKNLKEDETKRLNFLRRLRYNPISCFKSMLDVQKVRRLHSLQFIIFVTFKYSCLKRTPPLPFSPVEILTTACCMFSFVVSKKLTPRCVYVGKRVEQDVTNILNHR